MIILAGSLFGIQIGAIGTTYVKDHVVKFVMAAIMLLVLVSRFFYIPGYLVELGYLEGLTQATIGVLDRIGEGTLAFALLFGAVMILFALYKGMREHRLAVEAAEAVAAAPAAAVIEPVAEAAAAGARLSPLGRFERFVVASDGSEFSAAAVREAISMARKCGAELHVMSLVATGVEHEGLGETILKQELEAAQEHLDQVKAQAAEAGITCETHLIHGQNVQQEIVDLAERTKADFIIMGRRGRRGLARMMLGHATAHVIGLARTNILVVPRAAHIEGRHIVVGTDGSRFADAAAVTATNLAQFCNAKVTVVSVTTPSHGPERRAEAQTAVDLAVTHMKSKGVDAEGLVLEGQPAMTIVEVARERNADLIVTGSHGRGALERVLLGSTSERILSETPCAVLVVKGT
jgi:nucleotide-binding universal stress UspA family protein